jgi:DNA-binding MarR family transcriptional regulator
MASIRSGTGTAQIDSLVSGVAARASGYVLDLWIDLVSQAATSEPTLRIPSVTGLDRQQFRALNCLRDQPLTIRGLAQCLGVSTAAATATADRLVSAGAAERVLESLDGVTLRVVVTTAGGEMARDYRASQVAIVELLLGKLEPERKVVLTLAMEELATGVYDLRS